MGKKKFHQPVKYNQPGKYNNLDPRNSYHVTSSEPITSRYLSKLSNIGYYIEEKENLEINSKLTLGQYVIFIMHFQILYDGKEYNSSKSQYNSKTLYNRSLITQYKPSRHLRSSNSCSSVVPHTRNY